MLVAIYLANGTFLFIDDTEVNALNALQIVERGQLLFTPPSAPEYYEWQVNGPKKTLPAKVLVYDSVVDQLVTDGVLSVSKEKYVIHATRWPNYSMNTFGWGAATFAAPVFEIFESWLSDPETRRAADLAVRKVGRNPCRRGLGRFVFLTVLQYTSTRAALLIVFAYSLGTSVWSISSQSLWTHGPSEFFLALGTFALVRSRENVAYAGLCGFAYACATCCRQTAPWLSSRPADTIS